MKRIHFDVETEGFYGASTTGTLALTAAAYFPDITLTIAMTPSDFIWQGFMQGEKRTAVKSGPSRRVPVFLTWASPCPICPFVYQHPKYWQVVQAESKRAGDMLNSRKLSMTPRRHIPQEEEMIPVENIKGKTACHRCRG